MKPYFETENGKIYNCDCMKLMKTFPDNHIDLTVTSPPYDNLRTYNNDIDKSWNEAIWKPIIKGLYRVTKKGGVVVWVVGDATINGSETGTSFKQALWFMECGFNLHDTMIWEKCGAGAVGSLLSYWQNFEYMLVFSKGRPKSLNLIKDRKNVSGGKKTTKYSSRGKDGNSKQIGYIKQKNKGKRFNIWKIPGSTHEIHKATFPEVLANDHIISWSNEKDLIFDPFTGSGTTFKMALENKRRFIGSELSEEYCEIIKRRIKQSTAQLRLPGF